MPAGLAGQQASLNLPCAAANLHPHWHVFQTAGVLAWVRKPCSNVQSSMPSSPCQFRCQLERVNVGVSQASVGWLHPQ